MQAPGETLDDAEALLAYDVLTAQGKDSFLGHLSQKHKDLGKRQREYKKTLSMRYKNRNDTILEKSYQLATDRLLLERNDLRAQIYVANGCTHVQQKNHFLCEIKCHVECQEILNKKIRELKKDISNMERGIQHINRNIYDLNLRTVPDSQHQTHVAAARKKLELLENRLEVGIRQESMAITKNVAMREEINDILYQRRQFYDSYTKLMRHLDRDKKYLNDLTECATGIFESCIDAHDKIEVVRKKLRKDDEIKRIEAQAIMRHVAAKEEAEEFINTKGKPRELSDLQPKEYRRRDKFRRFHQHKINLYAGIISKLLQYSGSDTVPAVIEKFQQQESLYYSYFSFVNEMGYHVTLLGNSVNRLYNDLQFLRGSAKRSVADQEAVINELETELEKKKKRNSILFAKQTENEARLGKLLSDMNWVVNSVRLDTSPLTELVSDHSKVNLENIRRFTKLLETRVLGIVAAVYCIQHEDPAMNIDRFTIKDIEKMHEHPTPLEDIVLTQQCPECGEGEAFNMEDMGEGGVRVLTVPEAQRKLFDKVKQPEMHYRLHSISQCRLPRSRTLAAKRNL